MPQSPQSSSTLRPPASADPRVLPGWKSPCTRVSGSPHAATAAKRCRQPVDQDAQAARRRRRPAPPAREPPACSAAGTNASGPPVRRADLARARRTRSTQSPTAGRRAARATRQQHGQRGAPVVLARPRRRAAPAGPRPRSAAARRPGRAAAASRPRGAKNGGTTLSQAVPSAVGSRQMLDRFQVRTCTAGPVRSPARSGQRGVGPGEVGRRAAGPGVRQPQRVVGQRVRAGATATARSRRRLRPPPRPGRSPVPRPTALDGSVVSSRSTVTSTPCSRCAPATTSADLLPPGHLDLERRQGAEQRPSPSQSSSVTCRGGSSVAAARASAAEQALGQPAGHGVEPDPLLRHRVALADRDGLVVEGVEVDGDAERRADLVLAAVAAADRAGVVELDVPALRAARPPGPSPSASGRRCATAAARRP